MKQEQTLQKMQYFPPSPPLHGTEREEEGERETEMGRSLLGLLPTSSGLLRAEPLSNGSLRCSGVGGTRQRSTNSNSGGWRVSSCSSSEGEGEGKDWVLSSAASPYQVLGVDPSCSLAQLKAAFRARVKEFHPDVCKDLRDSDAIMRRVIQAYEMLSKYHKLDANERECVDPFEQPECEAFDLFVNEVLCIGKGCPYSCVKAVPHAFSFTSDNGTARSVSEGQGEDYQVQIAVGQCPRRCIHYVTPSQRAVLEELLYSALSYPYDSSELAMLDSLIVKANFENNRYQKPKKSPKVSTEYVDWL